MEVKKIVEGMTAVEVAEVIDSNFKGLNEEKANKQETDERLSELGSEIGVLYEKDLIDGAYASDTGIFNGSFIGTYKCTPKIICKGLSPIVKGASYYIGALGWNKNGDFLGRINSSDWDNVYSCAFNFLLEDNKDGFSNLIIKSALSQEVDKLSKEISKNKEDIESLNLMGITSVEGYGNLAKEVYDSTSEEITATTTDIGYINKNNGDVVESDGFYSALFKVKPNTAYRVSSMGSGAGGNSAPYAFYDEYMNFIYSYWNGANRTYSNHVVFTPYNASYIRVCDANKSNTYPKLFILKNINLFNKYRTLDSAGTQKDYDISNLFIKGSFIMVLENNSLDLTIRTNEEWNCLFLKVFEGQIFELHNVVGGTNGRAYALYNTDLSFVKCAEANATVNETITIEKDGILVINTKVEDSSIYVNELVLQNSFLVPLAFSYATTIPQLKEIERRTKEVKSLAEDTSYDVNSITKDFNIPFSSGYIRIPDGYTIGDTESGNWNHSDFIPIYEYSRYEVNLIGSSSGNVALLSFYEDKNESSVLAEYTNNEKSYRGIVKRPSEKANYVRFCGQSDTFGGVGAYNVVSKSALSKDENLHLKLLVIGNSYSIDSFSYVPFILKEYGITIELGIYYYGGAALNTHVQMWDSAELEFYYINTQLDTSWRKYTSYNPLKSVQFTDWDIITLQQSSIASVNANDYEPWARRLINLILDNTTKPVQFAWNININRKSSGDDLTAIANQILQNIESVCKREPINIIFPYGTAIFNARTNETLDAIGDGGHLWASDETHIQDGLPCYIAALANTQALFNKFYPQFSVMGDKTRPTEDKLNEWAVPWREGTSIGITEDNCRLAQICAILANNEKFKISVIYGNE